VRLTGTTLDEFLAGGRQDDGGDLLCVVVVTTLLLVDPSPATSGG
jgi:hypothetical protein